MGPGYGTQSLVFPSGKHARIRRRSGTVRGAAPVAALEIVEVRHDEEEVRVSGSAGNQHARASHGAETRLGSDRIVAQREIPGLIVVSTAWT